MGRAIITNVLIVAAIAVWQACSLLKMLDNCTERAREIIATADPLDRGPPPNVTAAISRNISFNEMVDNLSTILLDRYACRGNSNWSGTDWFVDQPALSSRLRVSFDKPELFGLFASTADMGRGDIGLSRGAARIYKKRFSQLADQDLDCLVLRASGRQPPVFPPRSNTTWPFKVCPSDGGLPLPVQEIRR